MTESMLERVARAMLAQIETPRALDPDTPEFLSGPFVIQTEDLSCVVIDGEVNLYLVAKAALEALLEPTEEMLRNVEATGMTWVFITMIKAALSSTEPLENG